MGELEDDIWILKKKDSFRDFDRGSWYETHTKKLVSCFHQENRRNIFLLLLRICFKQFSAFLTQLTTRN